MTPQRPALAEVLAAMTSESDASWWRMMTTDHETRAVAAGIEWRIADVWAPLRSWRREPETQRSPLRMTTPAEAVEALATARLWPWEPGDDPTRWWCERCEGCGWLPGWRYCACALRPGEYGHTADPPSHAAIVAVSSLGAGQLARYVHLAGEIARAAGCARARVVWRVMGREKITEHHRAHHTSTAWLTSAPSLTEVFTTEEMLHLEGGSSWRRACDWGDSTARAAWPALRALAVGEDATPQPTGVHLVVIDASRIVLAVEAL